MQTVPAVPDLTVRFTTAPGESAVVGKLVERGRRVLFEFESTWLERGLELSPFTLQGRPGLIEHVPREFGPLPGLFADSLPDGWGLLLMDRHFRTLGFDPGASSPLHRLAWLGTRTMGALTYHPPEARGDADGELLDLHQLSVAADSVISGSPAEVLPQLLRAGGSPGGARPKVLVGYDPKANGLVSGEADLPDGYEHWMVKFAGHDDGKDAGPVEFAYSLMAGAAGLEMPRTRLFETAEGDRFFGVQRFDRAAGNRRTHVHTFGNLIESNFRIPACDYRDLLKATSLLTRDHHDVLRAFRWMAFNVLAHNRDDHVKNFAFLLEPEANTWSLSPAYDLTFAEGPGGEHTMTVEGQGRSPGASEMLSLARDIDIADAEARSILDEVRTAVQRWGEFADAAGVTRTVRVDIGRRLTR